jgi:sterol 14-demethylase
MLTRVSHADAAIPRLAGGLPFVGHAIEFRRNPVGLLQRGRDMYGDIFSFLLFGRRVHVLTGSAGNAAFFKAGDDVLSAKEAYQFTVPIFGKGVAYDTSPELMDAQLRLVHPALRDEKMQTYAQVIASEVENYVQSWGEEGEADLLAAMNEITIYAAGRCLIGEEFRSRLSKEFVQLYHDLEGGLNMIAFLAPNVPLPPMRRRDRARCRVVELVSGLAAERRRQNASRDDFLDTLINARLDGKPLSDDTITGLLLTLLFAGQHTSAVLAAWSGVLLFEHPEYLAPIREEQAQVLGRFGMTLAAFKQLVLLERCIKEAERLYPPLIMLMRKALADFELDGHVIPRGDLVMVSPAVSHRIGEIFALPSRYDPGRFAPGREEDKRTPYALIGFGGGKHRCIGLAFAYQQIKIIWSMLLARYDFSLVHPAPTPDYTTFVVGPQQPCLVRYRKLSHAHPDSDARAAVP